MPEVGRVVTLPKGKATVKAYSISTQSVEIEYVDVATVSPRKKARKPTPKKKKKPLDKASSENVDESEGEFTLHRVLASFKNPRGCICTHICTLIYVGLEHQLSVTYPLHF